MMNTKSLDEIVQAAKDGDMAAFEEIYKRFSPKMLSVAKEITHVLEEAQDIMQESFISAINNISSLKENDKIEKWLIRIVANKSKDF